MSKLETISKSIKSKRRADLDTENFPLSKLTLSTYDIRKNRSRNSKLREDLKRDKQLQPITINVKTDGKKLTDLQKAVLFVVVNGRTRKLEMDELFATDGLFANVAVAIYENLTEIEENYLNAQINISQNPLTPDEKREFIIRHRKDLPIEEMAKALGLGMEMFKNYDATTQVSDKVLKAWTPKSEGHGRGSVKVEELGKAIRAYKRTNPTVDKKTLNKTFTNLGKESEKSDLKRDEKRIAFPKVVERVAELQKNADVVKEYDTETIIQSATQSVVGINKNSGDRLPVNSGKKYKIVDGFLKDEYDFAVLLFAEALYRNDNGTQVASETKRVIDAVDEIIAVGIELDKLTDMKKYAKSLGKTFTVCKKDALAALDGDLVDDNRKGFVYVNGAALFSQRPEFMNLLKKKYPNSRIAMVFLDLLFGKNQLTNNGSILRERLTIYGGAKNFDEVIAKFKSLVKFAKFKEYSKGPNRKCIVYV